MGWFPNGKLHLPETSKEGNIKFIKKDQQIEFTIDKKETAY